MERGLFFGAATVRPFVSDLNEVNLFQIRFAQLRVHGSMTFSDGLGTQTITFDETIRNRMLGDGRLETNQVTGEGRDGLFGFYGARTYPTADPGQTAELTFYAGGFDDYGDGGDTSYVVNDGSNLWMPFQLTLFSGFDQKVSTNHNVVSPIPSVVTCTLITPSGTRNVPMYKQILDMDAGDVTIEVTATDGWLEYRDPAGNNPIYNKDSGTPNYTLAEIILLGN